MGTGPVGVVETGLLANEGAGVRGSCPTRPGEGKADSLSFPRTLFASNR
jgi:hypothetical protein